MAALVLISLNEKVVLPNTKSSHYGFISFARLIPVGVAGDHRSKNTFLKKICVELCSIRALIPLSISWSIYNENLSDRGHKSFITHCFFFPADIPWHVYAKLTSLSVWTTGVVWLLSERDAGREGRLCVKRLINASLGFHWHFSGCRRQLPFLICFCLLSLHFPLSVHHSNFQHNHKQKT